MPTRRGLQIVAILVVGASCSSEHSGSTTSGGRTRVEDARSAAPSVLASVSASALPTVHSGAVPAPTRTDGNSLGMRYFYWQPTVDVPGTDPQARAASVLASTTLRELLGVGPSDGFVFQSHDDKTHMYTFRQTLSWQGQTLVVEGAHATVQLEQDTKLQYVGTGFRKGITLEDKPLQLNEEQSGIVATKEYEVLEKTAGKVTPHMNAGLRIHPVNSTHIVGYAIHVERADRGGRPYMIFVDAQSGKAVHHHRSWVE